MGENTKRYKGKFIPKHETKDDWKQSSYVPNEGELVVQDADPDTGAESPRRTIPRLKIGDGEAKVSELPSFWVPSMQAIDEDRKVAYDRLEEEYYFSPTNWSNFIGIPGESDGGYNRVYVERSRERGPYGMYALNYNASPIYNAWYSKAEWATRFAKEHSGEAFREPNDDEYPLLDSIAQRRTNGGIVVPRVPTNDNEATSKQYVDDTASSMRPHYIYSPGSQALGMKKTATGQTLTTYLHHSSNDESALYQVIEFDVYLDVTKYASGFQLIARGGDSKSCFWIALINGADASLIAQNSIHLYEKKFTCSDYLKTKYLHIRLEYARLNTSTVTLYINNDQVVSQVINYSDSELVERLEFICTQGLLGQVEISNVAIVSTKTLDYTIKHSDYLDYSANEQNEGLLIENKWGLTTPQRNDNIAINKLALAKYTENMLSGNIELGVGTQAASPRGILVQGINDTLAETKITFRTTYVYGELEGEYGDHIDGGIVVNASAPVPYDVEVVVNYTVYNLEWNDGLGMYDEYYSYGGTCTGIMSKGEDSLEFGVFDYDIESTGTQQSISFTTKVNNNVPIIITTGSRDIVVVDSTNIQVDDTYTLYQILPSAVYENVGTVIAINGNTLSVSALPILPTTAAATQYYLAIEGKRLGEFIDGHQVVLGEYNTPVSEAKVVVGNGTSDNRSNALVVWEDGRVTMGHDPVEEMDAVSKRYLGIELKKANDLIETLEDRLEKANKVIDTLVEGLYGGTDGLAYELSSDGTYYICAGPGDVTDTSEIEIAGYYKGLPVTRVKSQAFNSTTIETLELPNTITLCDNNAFASGISSVYINDLKAWATAKFNVGGTPLKRSETTVYVKGKPITELNIPEGVKEIGDRAFMHWHQITKLKLPSTLTRISQLGFQYCTKLTSVTIPAGVKAIGNGAFGYCTELAEVTFEGVLSSLYDKTFERCDALTDIYVPWSEGEVAGAPWGATNATIWYDSVRPTEGLAYTLSDDGTYYSCTGKGTATATDIVIDNNIDGIPVTKIGTRAFNDRAGITSVIIPNSVTSLGKWAFSKCRELTSVTIPDSVTSIGSTAFYDCPLTSVYITDIAKWCAISFGDNYASPLYYAKNLYLNGELVTELDIPDSVTSIGSYAFYGCSSLTSVTIPDSVTNIDFRAFSECSGLTSVTIGNGVTNIGNYAFYKSEGLTSVTIPDSVTRIGNQAFAFCTGLTSVYITDIAKWCAINFGSVDANPLYYAKNLYLNGELVTELKIPDSVTSIGDYAFRNCSGLTSVTIPDSVTSIGYAAFRGCTGLTSATIGNGVTSIGDQAFDGCSGLTRVTIPDSVISIGQDAFWSCSGLTSIIIGNGVTSIGNYAFKNCSNLTSITIPNSTTSIGEQVFYGCSGLMSATIGNGVTSIPSDAFGACSSLTDIYVPWAEGAVSDAPWGATNATIHYNYIPTEGLAYEFDDHGYYICTGIGTAPVTDIIIPSEYNGYPVTEIGEKAFFNEKLNSIKIPATVSRIMGGSLYNAAKTVIFKNAFRGELDVSWDIGSTLYAEPDYDGNMIYEYYYAFEYKELTYNENVDGEGMGGIPYYELNDYGDDTFAENIYVPMHQDMVYGAPWGATNATIHYNSEV